MLVVDGQGKAKQGKANSQEVQVQAQVQKSVQVLGVSTATMQHGKTTLAPPGEKRVALTNKVDVPGATGMTLKSA